MSERAPYSRIYWSVMDDEKFVDVYRDDAAFALWVRLLMTADALWPAAAPLPRVAKTKALGMLVNAGIVDIVLGDRYRIHGLDAERNRRADVARNGPKRDPDGRQTGPGREANGSQAKPSQAKNEPSQDETPRDPADIYWQLTGKFPKDRALVWIDSMASQYGQEPTTQALVRAHLSDSSVATLLSRTQDLLRAEARKLDVKEREDEARRLAEKRAIPRVEEPWRTEYREAIRKQYEALDGAA